MTYFRKQQYLYSVLEAVGQVYLLVVFFLIQQS